MSRDPNEVSLAEAARVVGASAQLLRHHIKGGRLASRKEGHSRFVRIDDAWTLVATCRGKKGAARGNG